MMTTNKRLFFLRCGGMCGRVYADDCVGREQVCLLLLSSCYMNDCAPRTPSATVAFNSKLFFYDIRAELGFQVPNHFCPGQRLLLRQNWALVLLRFHWWKIYFGFSKW